MQIVITARTIFFKVIFYNMYVNLKTDYNIGDISATLALHFDNGFSRVFSSEQSLKSFHHVVEPLSDVLTMF